MYIFPIELSEASSETKKGSRWRHITKMLNSYVSVYPVPRMGAEIPSAHDGNQNILRSRSNTNAVALWRGISNITVSISRVDVNFCRCNIRGSIRDNDIRGNISFSNISGNISTTKAFKLCHCVICEAWKSVKKIHLSRPRCILRGYASQTLCTLGAAPKTYAMA